MNKKIKYGVYDSEKDTSFLQKIIDKFFKLFNITNKKTK